MKSYKGRIVEEQFHKFSSYLILKNMCDSLQFLVQAPNLNFRSSKAKNKCNVPFSATKRHMNSFHQSASRL